MTLASLNGFGRLVARMAGASAGEWIGKRLLPSGLGGELQHAAIGSEMATRAYDATFAKLSRGQAAATIREAMMDPDAFRALAKNWNNVDDAATASNVVMRLLTRVPAYWVSAGVQAVRSQQPPGPRLGPKTQAIGMPPQSLGPTASPAMPGALPGPTLVPGGAMTRPLSQSAGANP